MEGCCFIFSFWYWPIFCETKIALVISWEKEVKGLKIAKFKGKENKWNVPFISSTGEDLNKPGSAEGGGGNGIPVYPKKICENTQKYPKFIQIYLKWE